MVHKTYISLNKAKIYTPLFNFLLYSILELLQKRVLKYPGHCTNSRSYKLTDYEDFASALKDSVF